MTREEAIEILREAHDNALFSVRTALETLIPELVDSKDEIIRKELLALVRMNVLPEATCLVRGGSVTRAQAEAYLEKQKKSGIKWLKSDNVKNPDKPYIDKAGMFYTTDGRMCHASEIEKQEEQKEIPLMGGDTDTYFDDLRITTKPLTSREWFDEGIKYAQRLHKEQKPAKWSEEDEEILDGLISLYSNTYSGEKWPWKLGGYITYGDIVKFLKSLRPHWKPSEEQMKALQNAVALTACDKELVGLYNQLKKL